VGDVGKDQTLPAQLLLLTPQSAAIFLTQRDRTLLHRNQRVTLKRDPEGSLKRPWRFGVRAGLASTSEELEDGRPAAMVNAIYRFPRGPP
jgi:hypothetical protein